MPGGRRWPWKGLPVDRLHVARRCRNRPASRRPVSRDEPLGCTRRRRLIVWWLVCWLRLAAALGSIVVAAPAPDARVAERCAGPTTIVRARRPRHDRAVPEAVEPGNDAFPPRARRSELEARLRGRVATRCRRGAARRSRVTETAARPGFRGSATAPDRRRRAPTPVARSRSRRAEALPRRSDARRARVHRRARAADRRRARASPSPSSSHRHRSSPPRRRRFTSRRSHHVRYDIVGAGTKAYRVQHVGAWQMTLAPQRRGLAGRRVDRRRRTWPAARERRSSPRSPRPRLGGTESFRRQLNIDLDAWMATLDSVLTRDSNGHHGVSVGDADGDGLDDLYVAQPAGLPNRLLPRTRRRHVRGRHRRGRPRRPRRHRAVAVRRHRQRRRPGPGARDRDRSRCCSSTTAEGTSRVADDAFRFASAAAGRADVDRDGRLRPRRLPRRVPVRLLVLLRRRRGQGGHADAVLRRAQRPAGRAVPQRRPRPVRRRDRARPGSTPATTATTSPPRGPTTTRTAGPTCSSPTTSAPRTCIAISARTDGRVTLRGRRGDGRRARSRRRHERGVPRLRQRRPARHLHRQHVERARPARHRVAGVHAGRAARGARALPASRARQLAVPQPRRRPLRGHVDRGRARRWGAGHGRPTRSTSTATAGRTSTSPTAC